MFVQLKELYFNGRRYIITRLKPYKYILFFVLILCSCQREHVTKDTTIIPVEETVGTGKILNLSDYV